MAKRGNALSWAIAFLGKCTPGGGLHWWQRCTPGEGTLFGNCTLGNVLSCGVHSPHKCTPGGTAGPGRGALLANVHPSRTERARCRRRCAVPEMAAFEAREEARFPSAVT